MGRIGILLAVYLLVAGLAAGLLMFGLWRRDRTEEDRVRDTVGDFLEACADEDFGEVWDLLSPGIHEMVAGQRKGLREDLDDEEFFVENARAMRADAGPGMPREFTDWFPWALPADVLRSLTIRSVGFGPDPDGTRARVVVRPVEAGNREGLHWRAEIDLKREDGDWRLDGIAFQIGEDLPAPPPPPAVESRRLEDGRLYLNLGVTPGSDPATVAERIASTGEDSANLVLGLRVDRDAPCRTLAPWLVAAARAGVRSIRVRAERRVAATRGTTAYFTGLEFTCMSLGNTSGNTFEIAIPESVEVPDVLLEFGRDPHPPADTRGQEGSHFRTVFGPVEGPPVRRVPDLLGRPANELDVVLAPSADATVRRLALVAYDLEATGYRTPFRLAVPDTDAPPLPASLLVNGLTPAEAIEDSRTTVPPVAPDHPALRRVLVRGK